MNHHFQPGVFQTGETRLSFIEGPPIGAPLVLVHGTASRWQPFQPILPPLAEKFHVFAIDLRGHGGSSHTPGAYRLMDYSWDLFEFIVRKIQAPAMLYGHSLGALVAIHLAATRPELVRSLILGDPPLYYHDTRTEDTFWHQAFLELLEFTLTYPTAAEKETFLRQNYPAMPPERRTERIDSLEGFDPDVLRFVISGELMEGISLTDLAANVACPVLLLCGNPQLGSALRQQDVDFARQHFSNLCILKMQTAGHAIIPVDLLPHLFTFLAEN